MHTAVKWLLCAGVLSLAHSGNAQNEKIWPQARRIGIAVTGGYSYNSLQSESINRFTSLYNQRFASIIKQGLELPSKSNARYLGVEGVLGIFRLGYYRYFMEPLETTALMHNGDKRTLRLSLPQNVIRFDLVAPLYKNYAYLGMALGYYTGTSRLESYYTYNFGRSSYTANDGLSGVWNNPYSFGILLGARLELNINRYIGVLLQAEKRNPFNGSETDGRLNPYKDLMYADASIADSRDRYMFLPEDPKHAQDDYAYFVNNYWEFDPNVNGVLSGWTYTLGLRLSLNTLVN